MLGWCIGRICVEERPTCVGICVMGRCREMEYVCVSIRGDIMEMKYACVGMGV